MSKKLKQEIVKIERCTTGWWHLITQDEIEARRLNKQLKDIKKRHDINKNNNL